MPPIYNAWYVRVNGRVATRILADDVLHLAAEIHQAFGLDDDEQVRLILNPAPLQPTGKGAICHPDGLAYNTFTIAQAGPRLAAAA